MEYTCLAGTLKDLPLADWIRFSPFGHATGVLYLTRPGERGEVHVRDGQVVHAVQGDRVGAEAVYALLAWTDGEHHFAEEAVPSEKTIHARGPELILEGLRHINDWTLFKHFLPPDDPTLCIARSRIDGTLDLRDEERRVLELLGQPCELATLEKKTGLGAVALLVLIVPLIAAGLVEIERPARLSHAPNPAERISQAVLARILTRLENF